MSVFVSLCPKSVSFFSSVGLWNIGCMDWYSNREVEDYLHVKRMGSDASPEILMSERNTMSERKLSI